MGMRKTLLQHRYDVGASPRRGASTSAPPFSSSDRTPHGVRPFGTGMAFFSMNFLKAVSVGTNSVKGPGPSRTFARLVPFNASCATASNASVSPRSARKITWGSILLCCTPLLKLGAIPPTQQ